MEKTYLSPKEASIYTGISISKLAKLRIDGKGCPYIRIGDSATKAVIRYQRSELDRWLSSCVIKTAGGI